MATQTLDTRYVVKEWLFAKLNELFPDGNFEVEVRKLNHIHSATVLISPKQESEAFILSVPRRLTNVSIPD
jgi:hypothetical protein